MIRGINHVTLAVSDMEIAFAFYAETLGLRPLLRSPRSAYFLAGDDWICLSRDSVATKPSTDYTHLAFSVSESDFADLSEKIRASGAQIFKDNRSEGASLYFTDPDGHKLEIHVGDWRTRLEHYRRAPPDPAMQFFDE